MHTQDLVKDELKFDVQGKIKKEKVALIEVKPLKNDYIAKEMAGGLGKKIRLGNNFLGGVLNRYLTSLFNAPPIALAQVAGLFKADGYESQAYYTSGIEDIDRETSLAVVLSSMVDYQNEVSFIKKLKTALPHIKVIVIGSFASAMPEIYHPVADCVIRGEPEVALQKILSEGFSSEKVILSPNAENLNELPILDWVPFIKNGKYASRPFSKELGISIQKSRGCSMTCNYCPYAAFYGKARQFDIDYVMKIIDHY